MKDKKNSDNLKSQLNQKEQPPSDKIEGSAGETGNQIKKINSKQSRYVQKKLGVILLFILVAGLLFFLVQNWQKIASKLGNFFSTSAYSENQQRVIDNFGLPQTFTLARDGDQILENWKYIYLDEIFVFQDGEFIARQHFNFNVEEDEGVYPNLEPKDFYTIKILEQLNNLLGREPSFEANIDMETAGEPQLFASYSDLLNVLLENDIITGLQTIALKARADSAEVDTPSPQTDATDDITNRPGKIFIANSQDIANSFSYYLDDPVFRLIKQRPLHFEGEYPSYGYCYSLDQGASFETEPQDPGACADEESMVWVINLYPIEIYENLDEIEMMGMEELTRNDKFVYSIIHTNGDLPAGLPQWPTILADVQDDFSVPLAAELQSLIK
jgi:hypothetical protein